MTRYLCKCGRELQKSTKAETTGNRDTADCTGCPYLLPYGPMRWDGKQHEYRQDVQGYECRMSQRLEYASGYIGNAASKTVLSVLSLDFDFLERISEWIRETYPGGELSGSFSCDAIRTAEYGGDGRYRMAIYCAQNRKGVAAKAALLEHFFDNHGRRRDLTPEEEKAHVLAAIETGIAHGQKGENGKVDYIISRNTDNELMYAWYRDEFWFWDRAVRKWIISQHAHDLYEKHHRAFPDDSPEAFMTCSPNFDALGDYEVPYECITALLSSKPKKDLAALETAEDGAEDVAMEGEVYRKKRIDQSGDAAATTTENAVINAAETATGPMDASSSSAPVSHADAGAATQSQSAADPASLDVQPSGSLAFDYSGLDDQTVADLHLAEREVLGGRRMAEMGLRRMADGVAIAHDTLCGGVVHNVDNSKHGNRGEDSFRRWCESVGVGKSTAYKLLQVSNLFDRSTPREEKVLEELSPSLLYAAAKPSAPAELVQAVKDGDITTHKQYQEALSEIRARDAKIEDLLEMSEAADRRAEEAERKRKEANEGYSAAMETLRQAQEDAANAESRARAAEIKARELETRPVMSELFDAKQRIRELESRPVEVAVKEPDPEVVEAKARELAAQRTAMLEAQVRSLQEDKNSALRRLDEVDNNAYLAAAEFADRAAETIDSIRTAFWALAAELSEADFFDALAPLDEAARKIRDREWEEDEANV